ncbi:MAG: hypothetical protein WC791_03450 [Candidatus Paceibacterota bacterium]|jgi:hypothetical protein
MRNIFLALLFAFGPFSFAYAADLPIKNAGFVPANIWYSKDPFFVGETIRIYTIVFNGSTYDIEGTVEFLDGGVPIGKTSFSISSGGRVRDLWIDWKATEGKHIITARIVDGTASLAGGKKSAIALDNTETGKSERTIDLDTDGDGVGNAVDTDDDNDTVSDVDELKNGTNPLKKDSNDNGISDSKELEIAVQQKAAGEKLLASNLEPAGSIAGTIKTIENAIPVPVKDGVTAGSNALESFRVGEGYQLRLAKENKAREIEAMKASAIATSTAKDSSVKGSTASRMEKPFAYVTYGILAALQYFFEWQIIFYGVLLYVVYRFLKWGINKIRNRE